MIYGYVRASTVAQCRNGNSLEEQTEALTAYGCDKIITEAYTGKTTERPQLNELLQLLCAGDTLVVTKLDRFSRTVIKGVLTVRMLFERGMIIERTQAGKALARTQAGYHDGRPRKYTPAQINPALELLRSDNSYRQVEAMTGISKSTLIRANRQL